MTVSLKGKVTARWIILGIAWCALASACTRSQPVATIDLLAFSTTVSFSIYAPPDNIYRDVVPALEDHMHVLEQRWRSFGDGSLAELNNVLEMAGCARTDIDTFKLVDKALEFKRLSNGLFDPTLGLEVDAWGFRDHSQTEFANQVNTQRGSLHIEDDKLCATAPLRIDLGGIAKGAIVLELAKVLSNHDIHNAIINIGGDMLVLGQRGDKPWRVAIQHPRSRGVIARIEAAHGEAIFSSGDYYRSRTHNGQIAHHILDPRTGAPALGGVATTVIHPDPLVADVAATALLVAGPSDYTNIAQRLGVRRAILIDRQLNVHTLPATNLELPATLSLLP